MIGAVMKAKKILKRIAKIEALMLEVTERSSGSAPHIRELLRDAKAAMNRAKKAVSMEVSSGTAKNPPAKGPKQSSKATPEPAKPKRKLSAAGRKAISDATKKRWAAKRAAEAKAAPAVAKKATVKKVAAKKPTPVKAAKAPTRKVAKKAPAKKAAVKAPAKRTVRVVKAAKTPAPPTAEATAATTPEQIVPEAPVQ
jgi:hypothetical protein